MIEILTEAPAWLWILSVIGGMIFAGAFNIPARKRLLSRESDTRTMAIRYDALNFIVFFITFPFAGNLMFYLESGAIEPLIINTAAFTLYSLSFWVVLKGYIIRRDRHGDN